MKVRHGAFVVAGAVMIVAPLVHGLMRAQPATSPRLTTSASTLVRLEAPPPPAASVENSTSQPFELGVTFDHEVLAPGDSDALMMLELSSQAGSPATRDPLAIALLIDTSGSMAGRKLENARAAAMRFIDQLEPRDQVTLIEFSRRETVRLERHDLSAGYETARAALRRMRPGGATCISCALERVYGLLGEADPNRQRWVILLSDGEANRGLTDAVRLEGLSRRARDGSLINTSTIGLGSAFNEDVLARIASGGTGDFVFVHNSSVIPAVLDHRLQQMTQVVARDVQVELVAANGVNFDIGALPDARGTGQNARLNLGHLSQHDQRRLLVPLNLPPGQLGQVATLRVSYTDPNGESRTVTRTARLARSDDATRVAASYNSSVDVEATRRRSARQVESALASCNGANQSTCLSGLEEAAEALERRAGETQAPVLAREATELRSLTKQLRRSPAPSRPRMARGAYLLGRARSEELNRGVADPYHSADMYELEATE